MRFLLGGGVRQGRRDTERRGGGGELGEDAAPQRLEAAALGGREVVGQGEACEGAQALGVAEELPLQRDGARRERGRRRLRAHGVHGRGEERLAIRLVGGAVRLDEDDRVAVPEAVTEDGADERVLVLCWHGAQGTREGGADLCPGERVPPRGPEAAADGLAATDPVGAVSQEARDACRGEAVLVEE
jgi:hypothetical protein